MSIRHKAQFPVPGCIVEFLQGNSPTIAYVLEVQNDRVRLYTLNKKEMKLPPARLLPWLGPTASPSLSRAEMDALLNEHQQKRQEFKSTLNMEELWQLAEGEIERASAGWFASLIFDDPDIDSEAAMGHALLDYKTHFKFSPPDFEIYSLETMQKRVEEAKAAALREALALLGNKFFHKLWEVYLGKDTLRPNDIPEAEISQKLEAILHDSMAEAESNDTLWKLLSRGLPNDPHLALYLATAWGIVPNHYNFLLDRAGYDATDKWTLPHLNTIETIQKDLETALSQYGKGVDTPFVTIDPESTIDRDDAFFVEQDSEGTYRLQVAIACPSLVWPVGTPFDKDVLRRATSLYLPEGDQHMLPEAIGCSFFSLDTGRTALALVTTLTFDKDGALLDTSLAIQPIRPACNMTLGQAEGLIDEETDATISLHSSPDSLPDSSPDLASGAVAGTVSGIASGTATILPVSPAFDGAIPDIPDDASGDVSGDISGDMSGEAMSFEQLLNQSETASLAPIKEYSTITPESYQAHAVMLSKAHKLATLLRQKRLENGAVILERPDCDVSLLPLDSSENKAREETHQLVKEGGQDFDKGLQQGLSQQETCIVQVSQAPSTPKAHRIIGELMIVANAAMGQWAVEQAVPLLYRNQEIALPPDYSAVWEKPEDIAKIARSLPAASLETLPRKHTGLGIFAYATCTSPMRRYVDLLNQGQIIAHLTKAPLPHSREGLESLLPLLQARLDSVGHIQRTRPRYWKLLFFRQQGDKAWWPGVVTEENNAFVTVALPWAQMMVRGRRKLFDEKIEPGAQVMIRVGKIHPLQNEITLLEVIEQ